MNWLSYGGGVNSTALAILLCEGRLPQYQPFRLIWSDTGNEKDETYVYIQKVFEPYLARFGRMLEKTKPALTVLEYWQKYSMVGSRVIRSCTDKSKIQPLNAYLRLHGSLSDRSLIGIDAGEQHRARAHPKDEWVKSYPLVEMGHDRAACVRIIQGAGLPVPPKSGCWHCPFMRVAEVIELAQLRPDRFEQIAELERVSHATHPIPPHDVAAGKVRAQWGDRPTSYWRQRAADDRAQGRLPFSCGLDPVQYDEVPCGCFDGGDEE